MLDKNKSLTPEVLAIIEKKHTEKPFSGCLYNHYEQGSYLCRRCGLSLFRSDAKFDSSTGWPSFTKQVNDHVKEIPDADGRRIEIICARCEAHLGHIFYGEMQNPVRYCVNSLSLDFIKDNLTVLDTEEIILGAGCFWGVEYFLQQLQGVLKTKVGYMGGEVNYPSYENVCAGDTGHFEVDE